MLILSEVRPRVPLVARDVSAGQWVKDGRCLVAFVPLRMSSPPAGVQSLASIWPVIWSANSVVDSQVLTLLMILCVMWSCLYRNIFGTVDYVHAGARTESSQADMEKDHAHTLGNPSCSPGNIEECSFDNLSTIAGRIQMIEGQSAHVWRHSVIVVALRKYPIHKLHVMYGFRIRGRKVICTSKEAQYNAAWHAELVPYSSLGQSRGRLPP